MRSGKKNDMKKIIELPHRMDDYACMWNGIEDLYIQATGETLPPKFFFVLASFGSFCYMKTPKAELKRMVALGDGRTRSMYEFLAPIVGFDYKVHEYKTFEQALRKIKAETDTGFPCMIGALDIFYLPHFEKLYHKEHIPFHYGDFFQNAGCDAALPAQPQAWAEIQYASLLVYRQGCQRDQGVLYSPCWTRAAAI